MAGVLFVGPTIGGMVPRRDADHPDVGGQVAATTAAGRPGVRACETEYAPETLDAIPLGSASPPAPASRQPDNAALLAAPQTPAECREAGFAST